MLYLGTSGYSYDDWVGPFYPQGLAKRDFLDYYVQHFSAVEVNFTHYALPQVSTMQSMADRTPEGFLFTVKSYQEMTIKRSQDPAIYQEYHRGLGPLREVGKLGCVLLQFPNSFKLERAAVDHLRFVREQWPEERLAVEFRHVSWVEDVRTFEFLREHKIAYCCVDEPRLKGLLPPVVKATADFGYVRFHGRNAAKWYTHEEAWERYNYLYRREELLEWVPRVRELQQQTDDIYLFFNNHYSAQAVQNATEFADLLDERAPP